ncbi:hypothetical protein GCM10025862_02300 [Arsenicicoccus piscis]|uniref:Uncharacterized protein n=1 Tax=Arsenicicoccus piscis TaxID=673954 RepID=A0ABQ6HKK0_9MICO|nr:hypothetical protein GCM10025862_02300 [Arsenicicoccus piscis]
MPFISTWRAEVWPVVVVAELEPGGVGEPGEAAASWECGTGCSLTACGGPRTNGGSDANSPGAAVDPTPPRHHQNVTQASAAGV